MTTLHEQKLREALQKVAALRGNVYESESKAEMQALIDAFMACEQALAATPEPAPMVPPDQLQEAMKHPGVANFENVRKLAEQALSAPVKESLTPEPRELVRLTQLERDRIATSCQSTQQVISATIDAMIAKNRGKV